MSAFWKELYDLRNNILKEREEYKNKYDVEQFITYLQGIILENKEKVEEGFRSYVRNNPSRNTYNIERTYPIPNSHANGLRIFFGFFGRDYIKEFIEDIVHKEYCGFSITMKNVSEKEDLKIFVNYYIDFTKIKEIMNAYY